MSILLLLAVAFGGEIATYAVEHKLPNGLTVLLEEDHRSDEVALHLRYGVGSGDEPDGLHGCAHLFEHLMFEGSKSVPNNKFDDWLTSGGGWNNAFTNTDQTAYHMAFPSGATDLALFLESDRAGFLDAGLDEANVTNQQGVVLQERYQGFEEPHGRDWDALTTLVFPAGHPYHVSTIGTVAAVKGFKVDGVRDFWKKYYRPQNGTLALVGNFTTADALAKVTTWFSDVPDPGPKPARPGVIPADPTPRHGKLEDKVEDRTIYLAWPTVDIRHNDMPALEMLSWVLSNGHGTRLDDALYYDKPLATGEGAWTFHGDVAGAFFIQAASDKTALSKLQSAATAVVADLVAHPPTDQEVLRAFRSVRGGLEETLQDPVSRAEALVDCKVLWGDANCTADQLARYQRVTSADIVAVAQRYLIGHEPSTLAVVPMGEGASLPDATPVELP